MGQSVIEEKYTGTVYESISYEVNTEVNISYLFIKIRLKMVIKSWRQIPSNSILKKDILKFSKTSSFEIR